MPKRKDESPKADLVELWTPREQAMADVAETLDAFTQRARLGEFTSVLIVCEGADGTIVYGESGYDDRHRLTGALEDLKVRVLVGDGISEEQA